MASAGGFLFSSFLFLLGLLIAKESAPWALIFLLLGIFGIAISLSSSSSKRKSGFKHQREVIHKVGGRSNKQTWDYGIDGYLPDNTAVQITKSRVGRGKVDSFETALERKKRVRGAIIGDGFTKGAIKEAKRARKRGQKIELYDVKDLN